MAHPRDTRNESLQCIACAMRQEYGRDLDPVDLLGFINWLRGEGRVSNNEKKSFEAIKDHVNIKSDYYNRRGTWTFAKWADTDLIEEAYETEGEINIYEQDLQIEIPMKGSQLEQWSKSCAWIANKLAASTNKTNMTGNDYIFYHADQKVDGATITFKDLASKIIKDVKKLAKVAPFSTAVNLLSRGSGDKWNPADMFAIKETAISGIAQSLNKFKRGNIPNATKEMIQKNKELNDIINDIKGRAGRNIEMIEEMGDLYHYNKFIHDLYEKGHLVPISLKKADGPGTSVKVFEHTGTKGIESALKLDVEITNVDYKPDAEKAIVEFEIGGEGGAMLDFRGFEPSAEIRDVQAQVQIRNSTANHGKITLPIYSFIVEESNGSRALKLQEHMRNRIFGNGVIPGASDHVFTPSSIFNDYANKNGARDTFSRRTLKGDAIKWGQYIQWLTKGRLVPEATVSKDVVVRNVYQKLGDPRQSTEDQLPSKKKGKTRVVMWHSKGKTRKPQEWPRNKDGSFKVMKPDDTYKGKKQDYVWAAKYIKNKVQSAESVFILDTARNVPTHAIKKSIIKSAYSYAASKGLRIFSDTEVKEFFSASTYVKVGG